MLVYVTSVMPERGETMASFGGSEHGPGMDPCEKHGMMGVKAELMPETFMQDCDEKAVAGALRRLARQPLAVFGQASRSVARQQKPSAYVVCAEAQQVYARRADRVVKFPSGHLPMLSRPELLARVFAEAAARSNA